MLKTDYAVIVEGKYDKIKLASLLDLSVNNERWIGMKYLCLLKHCKNKTWRC